MGVFAILQYILTIPGQAQSFLDQTFVQGIVHQYTDDYGGGVSFYDYNNDGWDDLTFCTNGSPITIFANEEGILQDSAIVIPNTENLKMLLWVDFDNDGDSDISGTTLNGPIRLYENDGEFNFTEVAAARGLVQDEIESYAHAWGDIDNDGWLDLFVCNYYANTYSNSLFRSNGDGTFTDVSDESIATSTYHYSLSVSFIDYDNDGWQDIYVGNDRTNNPNKLFHNLGNGTFEEISEATGSDIDIYCMTTTLFDYNLDGLLDLYLSNNTGGNKLLEAQDDLTYQDVADGANCAIYDFSWCATPLDFDNDMDEDLFVCCTPHFGENGVNRFFINNGDGHFIDESASAMQNYQGWQYNSAAGDLNNDGYSDLVVAAQAPNYSRLFTAPTGENNWLKVELTGVQSNRDGIGSLIEVWCNGVKQVRYTQCGEGYMAQSSQREIFGLGNALNVDSVKVHWLGGWVDTFYGVPANDVVQAVEGQTIEFNLEIDASATLCPGSTAIVQTDDPYFVAWENGSTDNSIEVDEEGYVLATFEGPFGEIVTDSIEVAFLRLWNTM